MVDRRVEIRVVANAAGQHERNVGDRRQECLRAIRVLRQEPADVAPELCSLAVWHRHKVPQALDPEQGHQVEHLVPDRHAWPQTLLSVVPEGGERQVLHGEVRRGVVRRFHPALQIGIVRLVDHGSSPSSRNSVTGSSKEHDPKLCAKSRRASSIWSVVILWLFQKRSASLNTSAAGSRSSSRATICSRSIPCQASVAAAKTFRNPCSGARGLSSAYVSARSARTGWCSPAVALKGMRRAAASNRNSPNCVDDGIASGVSPPVRTLANAPLTLSIGTSQ